MSLGFLLAIFALLIGTLFFLYAMKYYITLAVVLGFSRRTAKNGQNGNGNHYPGTNGSNGKNRSVLYHLFAKSAASHPLNDQNHTQGLGLISDHEEPRFQNQPFVSIHLPFYNEKKVANRILAACTSMDYDNYEVIVVDDSTDETVQILEKWKKHPRVKVIHRESRQGWKGGALQVALEHSDPRTEFIIIFDADFIPYPDTIWQFLKYFNIAVAHEILNSSKQKESASSVLKTNHIQNGNYQRSHIAAVQGYQWHVLNKNENWITRGVRTEFAGSYVVERPGTEAIGSMKLIAGSVYMIRADLLRRYGWGTSITEDFQLTLRLYQDGYRVIYTPYIQTPSECVSTIKRLVRQRMRWAEGHTHQVKKYFWKILRSPHLKKREKLEFLYLAPYYLQSTFFLTGTLCWFISDAILRTPLPFWTALWGWCLVLTNMFALPLMNGVGLFLEEAPRRDYLGLFSFILLSYILVPFQAYASVKGLLEKEEGHWFRTPKTGIITDTFLRSRFRRFFGALLPGRQGVVQQAFGPELAYTTANNRFDNFEIRRRNLPWLPKTVLIILLIISINLVIFARNVPEVLAAVNSPMYVSDDASTLSGSWLLSSSADTTSTTTTKVSTKSTGSFQYQPGLTNSTAGTPGTPTGKGWLSGDANGVTINTGTWSFTICETDNGSGLVGYLRVLAFKVQENGSSITSYSLIYDSGTAFNGTDLWDGAANNNTFTSASIPGFTFDATYPKLYVEYWNIVTTGGSTAKTSTFVAGTKGTTCSTSDPQIVFNGGVVVFEKVIVLLAIIPFLPLLVRKLQEGRVGA